MDAGNHPNPSREDNLPSSDDPNRKQDAPSETLFRSIEAFVHNVHRRGMSVDAGAISAAMSCLFDAQGSLHEVLPQLVRRIPSICMHPDIACARLVLLGKEYATANFRPTSWGLIADIRDPNDKTSPRCGFIEVCYLAERPVLDNGPFLHEERVLLDHVAQRIEQMVQHERISQTLAEAKQEAVDVSNAKNEFLANISHEIRSPMTAILGFADILLENTRDPASIDAAITIKRNSCYLLNLINNILDLSMLETGKLLPEKSPCSLINCVADVVSIMRVRSHIEKLTLQTEFIGPLPETIVTDSIRLRQVLINLIDNAIRYTEAGTVRVVTRMCNEDGRSPAVQFEVIDTGIGMDETEIASLFRPFSQPDRATRRGPQGPGLGLTITKQLVELLGGQISVESKKGSGAAFRVTIDPGPLGRVAMIADPAEAVIRRYDPAPTAANAMPKIAGRVLLVEDGRDNQRLIAHILRKAGAEVAIAENGQEAIDKILSDEAVTGIDPACHVGSFDVVLMDMQMPVLDGYNTTRQLRSMGYSGPIVALTAHALSQDRQKCLDAGCDEYLTKPVEQRRLLDTVAAIELKGRHTRSTAQTPLLRS
jgi:signal transduction histidine kinase/FixJ family two-component response regulator